MVFAELIRRVFTLNVKLSKLARVYGVIFYIRFWFIP